MNTEKEIEKKKLQDLKRRFILFLLIILVACGVLLRQLVHLQITEGQKNLDNALNRIVTKGVMYAKRGNIYDRKGIPIAGNRMGYCIQYVNVNASDAEKNAMLNRLARLLDKNGDRYKSTLSNIFNFNSFTFRIKSDGLVKVIGMSDADKESLMEADEKEIFQYMREKTFKIDPLYTDQEAWRIMEYRYEMMINPATIQTPLLIAEDVSKETMVELEERNAEFMGISTYPKPYREYYNAALVGHILGYIRNIGDNYPEWSEKYPELGYQSSDLVGWDGIERAEEQNLRGINGITRKEVDTEGRIRSYKIEVAPKPGQDIYLTIDLNLQKAAYDSLERNIQLIREREHKKNLHDANAGAVVAMDVKNGEILAMVSFPTYDPLIFLEGNWEKINELNNDPNSSALNRATQGRYAPGSTYKPLIAIAGLETGTITQYTRLNCPNSMEIGGLKWRNPEGNQGLISLEKALATSSNMFFFQTGFNTGIDNIVKWAKNFGFGKPTGVEIGESIGALASREFKLRELKEGWVPADTVNASIGQLYNAFTPIQLVSYVSTIGNGGLMYRPHLVLKRKDSSGETFITEIAYQETGAQKSTIEAVKKGMVAVTNSEDGTAVNAFKDFPFEVAGKTGTAETGHEETESSNALFVCYAPADDPQIAVAVVVEKGVVGAWTASIARDVLMTYFNIQEHSTTQ
ncbi:MAG: penicillin-binding protein 2 [Thermoclostridium sp.]|nr:penicillin-binding protein 2 [Thermoclostridium sp.]